MNFSEFRAKALNILWPKVKVEYGHNDRWVINQPGFSTWDVDDICAMHWKYNNTIANCVDGLFVYIEKLIS